MGREVKREADRKKMSEEGIGNEDRMSVCLLFFSKICKLKWSWLDLKKKHKKEVGLRRAERERERETERTTCKQYQFKVLSSATSWSSHAGWWWRWWWDLSPSLFRSFSDLPNCGLSDFSLPKWPTKILCIPSSSISWTWLVHSPQHSPNKIQ